MRFYLRFKDSRLYAGTMDYLRPCIVGLIGAAAFILVVNTTWSGCTPSFQLVAENFPDYTSWLLLAAAFIASYRYKTSPILLILFGAAMGLILY